MADNLEELLRAQLSLYNNLLESAGQKKVHLLSNNIEALRRVTVCENGLIGKLQKLEREREKASSDLAGRLHISAANLTLADLISRIDDTSARNRLDDLRKRLRGAMDSLKTVNEQNRTLINQSLEYLDYTMNLVRSAVAGPVYAGSEEIPGQVFFDARG